MVGLFQPKAAAAPLVETFLPCVEGILPAAAPAPTFVSYPGNMPFQHSFFNLNLLYCMKTFSKSLALLLVSFAALLGACRKNAEEVIELLSDSEAAEIIETAVSDRSAGFTLPTVDMAQIVETYLQNCGTPGDTTLTKSASSPAASYSMNCQLNWLVNCSALGVPQDATLDLNGNGNFSTTRWNGTGQSTGNLVMGGLAPGATNYTLNGTYSLNGTITGNLRRIDPSFNCQVVMTLSALTLDKTTYQINGGNGTAVITAQTANGTPQTINATLVFNTNGTVTVTVNGHTHTF
jgi:hypothetical protein